MIKRFVLSKIAILALWGMASVASAESMAARADPRIGPLQSPDLAHVCGERVVAIENELKAGHALLQRGKVSEYRKHRRAEKALLNGYRADCGEVDVRWRKIPVGASLMLATGLEITGETTSSACFGFAGRIRGIFAQHLSYAKKAEAGGASADGMSARSEAANAFELLEDYARDYRDLGCGDVDYDIEEADF